MEAPHDIHRRVPSTIEAPHDIHRRVPSTMEAPHDIHRMVTPTMEARHDIHRRVSPTREAYMTYVGESLPLCYGMANQAMISFFASHIKRP